jgi:photosystem II stability/assembly factor-like uncharacterized protein
MLNTISCASANHCAVAGFGAGEFSALLTTSDGGQTWTSRTVPSWALGLDGVSCPSATACIAVGSTVVSFAGSPVVVASNDGGATWTRPHEGQR